MRTYDVLIEDMDNIKTLYQYLYLDEDYHLDVHNSLGVPMRVRMDSEGNFYQKNMNFPKSQEYRKAFTIPELREIICELRSQRTEKAPEQFNNRWEEIQAITTANVELSKKCML